MLPNKTLGEQGLWHGADLLATLEPRKEDQKFQAGLGCPVSSDPAFSSLVNMMGVGDGGGGWGWGWFLDTAQYPRFNSL